MSRYMNHYYDGLKPYVPGEIPQDPNTIKLNTNESPYPPSKGVCRCFTPENAEKLRLYGDPANRQLNRAIAGYHHIRPENVITTGGSDETLELAMMAYCADGIAYPDETYGFYRVLTDLHQIPVRIIPLKEDLSIDPDDYENLGCAVIFANPNAPTGLYLNTEQVEKILRSNPDHVVIVDEAYVDFGNESMIPLIHQYDNLLVIQTYSKSRNLAGARIGFAAGNEELIKDLEKLRNSRNPYDVTRISQLAGVKAIEDSEYYRSTCEKTVEIREWTKRQLKELGFSGTDSQTNFVFVKHETIPGEMIQKKLKEKGILVRWFDHERIRDYNRISIGTREDMESLMKALKEICDENG